MTITGPTWVFHRTELPRMVRTQEEYDALGEGWSDTPATFYPSAAEPPASDETTSSPRRRKDRA